MSDVRAVEPFIRGCTHGFIVCVEDETGCQRDAAGRPVILCRGLLHGSVAEMTAQVDYVVGRCRVHGNEFCTIIETRHPSFRFPDAALRAVLRHLRVHASRCGPIHFVGLSLLIRRGIKLFAYPFLDDAIKSRLSFASRSPLQTSDFDPIRYVEWRRAVEGIEEAVEPRPFSYDLLAKANDALRREACRGPVTLGDAVLLQTRCEKRGGGGLFGSTRWKPKDLFVTATHLVYRDDASTGAIALNDAEWALHATDLCVRTPTRSYEFRFATEDEGSTAADALRQTSGISAVDASIDGERI